jgi:N-acetylmuramoyl-L-alanine amidase
LPRLGVVAAALAVGGAAQVAAASSVAPLEVQAVRVAPGGATTRIEIELSRATAYKFFMLDAPRRAVIDLHSARLSAGLALPRGAGHVTSLRVGRPVASTLRFVVEVPVALDARAVATAGRRGPGSRLLLEVGTVPAIAAANAAAAILQSQQVSPPAVVPVLATRSSSPPADRDVAVAAAHAPADTGRAVVVAIDAGHGGDDPGAIGPTGTREKDAVLAIARALAERINREAGMRAVLTRDGDYFLTLRQRISRARTARADMFVSVHADAVRNSDVSGASVYVLSEKGATDEQARWLAERENAADLKGGVSLDDKDQTLASVLLDLSQSASITASMHAAERVLRSLDRVGEVRKPRVQQAGFVVLKSPDIPSMLVETAFISNPQDERLLRREEHRERLAEAIFRGVHNYFEEHPPEGTRFAQRRRLSLPTAQAAR